MAEITLPAKLVDLDEYGVARIEVDQEGDMMVTIFVAANSEPAQSMVLGGARLVDLGLALCQFADDLDVMRRGEIEEDKDSL